MQYAYTRHTEQYGIVYIIGDGLQGLLATHTTHVDVLLELQAALRDVLLCLLAQVGIGTWALGFLLACSLLCGRFKLGELGHGAHHAEGHCGILSVNLFDGADGLLAFDSN